MVSYIIIGIGICGVLLILIAVWLLIRYFRNKKKKERPGEIPKELLDDFEELERRLKESNGNTNPHQILWEYAREKSRNSAGTTTQSKPASSRTSAAIDDSRTANGNIQGDREYEQGRDIQIQPDISNTKEQSDTTGTKRKPKINWEDFN